MVPLHEAEKKKKFTVTRFGTTHCIFLRTHRLNSGFLLVPCEQLGAFQNTSHPGSFCRSRHAMDERILEHYLHSYQLVYGKTCHQPWNHLRIAGCNNTRPMLAEYFINHPEIPEECREPDDGEPFTRTLGGREGPPDSMMYTDIIRCPTLDANARVIQRAWKRFSFGSVGTLC